MEKLYVVKAENAGNLMINITFSDYPSSSTSAIQQIS